jgi:5-methylcytosine-specific restriction endonuclease McrA
MLSRNKSPVLVKFSKFSSGNHKKIVKHIQNYVFYIFTPVKNMDIKHRYSLTEILKLLNNDKLVFVEFIQQMNIYFNERQIIHNNFFSMDEINDILIHIYIDELTQPTIPVINNTMEILLDMVDDRKTVNDLIDMTPIETIPNSKNPFSDFMFNDETSPIIKQEKPRKPLPVPSEEFKYEMGRPSIMPKQREPEIIPKQHYQEPTNNKVRYKKKSIPLVLKRRLWDKYFGEKNGIATCPCCKMTQISTFSFHCGHIVSERNGGALVLDNLIPICQSCNSSMGTKSYNEFCESIGISNDIIY